ncbi:uroporphyrinogen-III synthase [soil metagenome]
MSSPVASLMSGAVAVPGPGPLAGYTVGVTADRRADEQIELLERRGAKVIHAPTIRTLPLHDEGTLAAATRQVLAEPLDAVVLTTALGTRGWIGAAEGLGLADDLLETLGSAEVFVRGSKAKGAASTLGLTVAWAAPTSVSEVRDELLARGVAGLRIAVQLDGSGNEPMLADLEAAGAAVVPVPIYCWTEPEDPAPAVRLVRAVVDQRIDALTFTTRTALAQLVAIAEREGRREAFLAALNRTTAVVCVGPVCADAARAIGVDEPIEPARHRLGAMVYEFAARFAEDRRSLAVAGLHLSLQGRLVTVGDAAPLQLTDRERDVLLALADAGGRVLSKRELLAAVWGTAEHDTHLVEVVVGRLRQRLGDAAVAVETVHRRGYRLAADVMPPASSRSRHAAL